MSVMFTIGSFAGTNAARVVEGSRLASTQFAQGASLGYTAKAEELRAQRAAILAGRDVVIAPPRANKVDVKRAVA